MAQTNFLRAQNFDVSLPEKLNYGTNRYEVLGENTEGTVVLIAGKSIHTIAVYSSELKLKWKKPIALKEVGQVSIGKIYLTGDSAIVFYSVLLKGMTVLKAAKVNAQMNLLRAVVVLDTLSTTTLLAAPPLNYSCSAARKRFVVYYDDLNNGEKRKLYCLCIDTHLKKIWQNEFRADGFVEPDVLSAAVLDSNHCWFIIGENQVKNFHNDYPYNKVMLVSVNDSSGAVAKTIIEKSGMIFNAPILKCDLVNRVMVVAGIYASSPGNESDGIFLLHFNFNGELLMKKFTPYSTELLSKLSGNTPPKRNDGFFSFRPSDFIIRRDGGIIFMAESFSISTEAFNSPGYGSGGGASSLTVNYYHYNEILALSLNDTGLVEWNQVLPKKQQTESDGGLFSSFHIVVAPTELILVFNDFSQNIDMLSYFTLKPDGNFSRTEIFNADKKGLLPLVREGEQISSGEIVMPSLKKGYLQFIKLTF